MNRLPLSERIDFVVKRLADINPKQTSTTLITNARRLSECNTQRDANDKMRKIKGACHKLEGLTQVAQTLLQINKLLLPLKEFAYNGQINNSLVFQEIADKILKALEEK